MSKIIKTEFWKLKRYSIIWAGVALMFLCVLLTLYTSIAQIGIAWDFPFLVEQVMQINVIYIFPMSIALLFGYLANREVKDDTLKNLLTVPISMGKIMAGKAIVCAFLSFVLGLVEGVFTLLASLIVGFGGLSALLALNCLFGMAALNFLLFCAVAPLVLLVGRFFSEPLVGVITAFLYGYGGFFAFGSPLLSSIYPVTACLGVIGYRSADLSAENAWNRPLCVASVVIMAVLALVLAYTTTAKKDAAPKKPKKSAKQVPKKGW